MTDTPIYVEAIREAKRRTRRHSPERRRLEELDERTRPQERFVSNVQGSVFPQAILEAMSGTELEYLTEVQR